MKEIKEVTLLIKAKTREEYVQEIIDRLVKFAEITDLDLLEIHED